jgi:hypothetical protein
VKAHPDPDSAWAIPLVTTVSEGGPHDDESYVAGFEMGEMFASLGIIRPHHTERYVRTESLPMLDLLAMRFGYSYTASRSVDGWTWVELRRGTTAAIPVVATWPG